MGGLFLSSSSAKRESYLSVPSPVRCRAGSTAVPSPKANQGGKKVNLSSLASREGRCRTAQAFSSHAGKHTLHFQNKTPLITPQLQGMLSCWRSGSPAPFPQQRSSLILSTGQPHTELVRTSRVPAGSAGGSAVLRESLSCSLGYRRGCGAAAAGSGRGAQKVRTHREHRHPRPCLRRGPALPPGLMLARGHPAPHPPRPAASPSHLVGRLSPRWGPCSSGSLPARRSAAAPTRGPPAPPAAARPRSAPPRRPPPPRPRTGTRRAPRRPAGRSPAARRARGSARTAAPGWTSGSSSARPATWRCASLRARGARPAGARGRGAAAPLRPSPPARLRARGGRAPPPARRSAPSLLPS